MNLTIDNKIMKTSYGIIWKILNTLDLALDLSNFNAEEQLNAKRFKITENRFLNYLAMLQNAGYVEGVKENDFIGEESFSLDYSEIRITLEGIQFLLENSTMQRIANVAEKIGISVAESLADVGTEANKPRLQS